MRRARSHTAVIVLMLALMACRGGATTATQDAGVELGAPITTFTPPSTRPCPAARPHTVLVDATHDGGVWWFPQADVFNAGSDHQGRALAEHLRGEGYAVIELGRGTTLPTDSMRTFATVIRAGYYSDSLHHGYSAADLRAYDAYLACPRTLVLLGEFLRDGQHDVLAESLGIQLTGMITGIITDFTAHELTTGVVSMPFRTGSFLESESDTAIQVLGRLPTGERVMGVLAKGNAEIFFIGDTNGIEEMPKPLLQNLIAWGFR